MASDVLDAVRGDFRRALIPGVLALIVLVAGSDLGGVHAPELRVRLIAVGLAAVFAVLGIFATRAVACGMARAASHTSPGASAAMRMLCVLTGYLVVAVCTLGLLTVPLQHLLVGGAVTGVVIGVAAQQPLSNLFAGLLFLTARPVAVGHTVRVHSGALGGPLDGTISDIGLIYTTLRSGPDTILIPNAALLNSALRSGPSTTPLPTEEPPPTTKPNPDTTASITNPATPPRVWCP